jgi:protein arginine N-methyltransferase 1
MSFDYYRGLLAQRDRIEPFRREIARVVKPGDRVLEIGAGLGTYSFFAAQAGAKHVWAVEGGPVIAVAKALASANGYADRVTFVRGWYPQVELPQRMDVVILEDYPARLLDAWTFSVLRHINTETLGPGGRIVPTRARLNVVPVMNPKNWTIVGPLGGEEDSAYGLDWTLSREYIYNSPLQTPLTAADFRHDPKVIAEVRLDRVPDAAQVGGSTEWRFDADTMIHGLGYWFDLEVGPGTWLSNAPSGQPGSWGYLYLPISEAFTVPGGVTVSATVAPEVDSDGTPGWLTWEVRCGDTRFRGHEFKSFPATLDDVAAKSRAWVPDLTPAAKLEARILELVDGRRPVGRIAEAIAGTDVARGLSANEVLAQITSTLAGRTSVSPRLREDPRPWGRERKEPGR